MQNALFQFIGNSSFLRGTTSRPGLFWLAETLLLSFFVAFLDHKLVLPFIFQMCLFYFFLVRPVFAFLGFVKPLIFRRRHHD